MKTAIICSILLCAFACFFLSGDAPRTQAALLLRAGQKVLEGPKVKNDEAAEENRRRLTVTSKKEDAIVEGSSEDGVATEDETTKEDVQRRAQSYRYVSIGGLNLNREGKKLTTTQRWSFSKSHTGFRWNSGDNDTVRWRPQGITGLSSSGRKWLAVSWYGRGLDTKKYYDNVASGKIVNGYDTHDYRNRGARVSFVDVTSMDNIRYRHVLLVDEQFRTFTNIHAGGLAYVNSELHVPDTRTKTSSGRWWVHVFPISSIREVPERDRARFYNYRYVMVKKRDYTVITKPSCYSYDWGRRKFMTAEWSGSSSKRVDFHVESGVRKRTDRAWSDIQGVGADGSTLWVSRSFGRNKSSKLEVRKISSHPSDYHVSQHSRDKRTISYPPGLEDIHVTTGDNIWMLTEFGPKEQSTNDDRTVFAVKKSKLRP